MRALISFSLLWLLCAGAVSGQDQKTELFINLSGNLHMPRNTPTKGTYPVLWLDKEYDPKLRLGGVGVGASLLQPLSGSFTLKGQANFSRHTYWEEPEILLMDFGYKIGEHFPHSSDYTIGLAGTIQYALFGSRFSIGTGFGAQVLLFSNIRRTEITGTKKEPESIRIPNKYYRTLMPVLPIELSYKTRHALFNVRYEHALLNRYKNELASEREDHYSLLTFEIGLNMPLNRPEYKQARKEAKEIRKSKRKTLGPTF